MKLITIHPSSFRLHPLLSVRTLGATVSGGEHLNAFVVAAVAAGAMGQVCAAAVGAGRESYFFGAPLGLARAHASVRFPSLGQSHDESF